MPDLKEENPADVSDAASEVESESDTFHNDQETMAEHNMAYGPGNGKKQYDPKDPARPRRKKARRACFACQRAHLTCGK